MHGAKCHCIQWSSMKIILIEITKSSLGHVGVINKKDELIETIIDRSAEHE